MCFMFLSKSKWLHPVLHFGKKRLIQLRPDAVRPRCHSLNFKPSCRPFLKRTSVQCPSQQSGSQSKESARLTHRESSNTYQSSFTNQFPDPRIKHLSPKRCCESAKDFWLRKVSLRNSLF